MFLQLVLSSTMGFELSFSLNPLQIYRFYMNMQLQNARLTYKPKSPNSGTLRYSPETPRESLGVRENS